MLGRVFTDWYATEGAALTRIVALAHRLKPDLVVRMLDRHAPGLDAAVVQNPALALKNRLSRSRFPTSEAFFAWESEQVARWIERVGLDEEDAVFGFVRNVAPELCRYARSRRLLLVVDQMIAPRSEEDREASLQHSRFPDWAPPPDTQAAALVTAIEKETWAAANRITCASEYVRSLLVKQGVAEARVEVIPYPIDTEHVTAPERPVRPRPVVGFVGAVGLRKGAPYFAQVASRLRDVADFVMVGPVGLTSRGVQQLSSAAVEVVGPVPRSHVAQWMERFDVFLFPSTCEGSAGAVLEAMASGLPIVTSPNSGTLVRHGVDGFVIRYDDIDALADAVTRLSLSHELRTTMGKMARSRVEAFGFDWYSARLASIFEALF